MPHCIIEATKNILQVIDHSSLMKDVANAIFSLGCFSEDDIKIRLYPIEDSFLGIKKQDHSYITADIQVLDNKTDEQLDELVTKVQEVMEYHVKTTIGKTSITSKVSFLNKKYYKRFKNP